MKRWQDIGTLLTRWDFAALVGVAALIGLLAGATVAIPSDVPGVALQAVPVYRLEVGGAIFVGLYLVAMAFILSLRNRAFTEFGTGVVRARSLGDLPDALLKQERVLSVLLKAVTEIGDPGDDREGR